jgi:predicted nicotinamide N-methyase
LFVQGGAGVARYSISNPLISGARENLALSAGAGVRAPIHSRIEAVGLVKDYIVSFQSVDDLAALGVTGRRSHTIALMASLTFSW